MARYLVRARPRLELYDGLRRRLDAGEIHKMRPFGFALDYSLENARMKKNDLAVWEEEDDCSPPLAPEREAVLDRYFDRIMVERVEGGEGWQHIKGLPSMWARVS